MFSQLNKCYLLFFLLFFSLNAFAQEIIHHTVTYGETKYRLSKVYQISIEELERQNPQIIDGLQAGQELTIDLSYANTDNKPSGDYIKYFVENGDSKSAIAMKFNVTIDELERINPNIRKELYAYEYIYVPANGTATNITGSTTAYTGNTASNNTNTGYATTNTVATNTNLPRNTIKYDNLSASVAGKTLSVGFLYPSSLDSDSKLSAFSKGAQMAIDSVKKLGVDASFFNVNVTAMTSKDLMGLSGSNALISLCNGKVTEKLQSKINEEVPTFYALSQNDSLGMYKGDVFFAASTKNYKRDLVLNYLKGKGNIIIVDDYLSPLDNSVKYSFPNVKVVKTDKNGLLNESELLSLLSKMAVNYVVLNTTDTNTIINSTNLLLPQTRSYQIQLASFMTNTEMFSDKVSNKRYMVLKLILPVFEGAEFAQNNATKFKKSYTKKFGNAPTEDAVAGFDITFDALIRLSQTEQIDLLIDKKTKYVTIPFKYEKAKSNVYINQAMDIYQLVNENTYIRLN